MPMLTNSPAAAFVVLRLEARKAFSFLLTFKDSDEAAVDITDCTFEIVAKAEPFDSSDTADADNFITNSTGTIVDAEAGVVRFDLQASDLDVRAGEYPFVIVMTTSEDYPIVAVKGSIDLLDNPEVASTSTTYAAVTPGSSLDVILREQSVVTVRVGSIIPPGFGWLSESDQIKLDAITITEGGLEVDLSGYATTAAMAAADAATLASAEAYTDGNAAPTAHTHRVIELSGISRGTADPSGGVDGDIYLKYAP